MQHYTDEEKRKLLKAFEERPAGIGPKEMAKRLGVSDCSIYNWRKELNGKYPQEKEPITSLAFNIVQAKEAKTLVSISKQSRFSTLKEGLLSQLTRLRKTNAITFQGPKDGDKKEVAAIHHACYVAIRKAGLPFSVYYSKSRNLFIVLRKEEKE